MKNMYNFGWNTHITRRNIATYFTPYKIEVHMVHIIWYFDMFFFFTFFHLNVKSKVKVTVAKLQRSTEFLTNYM